MRETNLADKAKAKDARVASVEAVQIKPERPFTITSWRRPVLKCMNSRANSSQYQKANNLWWKNRLRRQQSSRWRLIWWLWTARYTLQTTRSSWYHRRGTMSQLSRIWLMHKDRLSAVSHPTCHRRKQHPPLASSKEMESDRPQCRVQIHNNELMRRDKQTRSVCQTILIAQRTPALDSNQEGSICQGRSFVVQHKDLLLLNTITWKGRLTHHNPAWPLIKTQVSVHTPQVALVTTDHTHRSALGSRINSKLM